MFAYHLSRSMNPNPDVPRRAHMQRAFPGCDLGVLNLSYQSVDKD